MPNNPDYSDNPYEPGTPEYAAWEQQQEVYDQGQIDKAFNKSGINEAGQAATDEYNSPEQQARRAAEADAAARAKKLLDSQTRVTDPYQISTEMFKMNGASPQGMYDQAAQVDQRQMPQFNFGYQDQTRNAQMGLMQQLQAQANGQGPSLAQMQLQRGQESAMANAMAMGASQRGANQAGALRNIGTQQAGIQQGLAADSAQLRMQEQMMAQQQLAGLTGQMRQQDIGASSAQTQFAQQSRQMNDQMVQFYTSQGMSLQDAQLKAQMELEKLRTQQNIEQMKIEQERDAANKKLAGDVVGGAMDMVGGGLGAISASDENLKTDIAPADSDLYEFLDTLEPHSYSYLDEKHGKGERVSVMAQELEKSPLGEAFVFETDDGKMVDYGKGLGTMLAAQAALHRRLKKLEDDENEE